MAKAGRELAVGLRERFERGELLQWSDLPERVQRQLCAGLVEDDPKYFEDASTDLDAKQCAPMLRDGNYFALGKLLADLVAKQCRGEIERRLEHGDFFS